MVDPISQRPSIPPMPTEQTANLPALAEQTQQQITSLIQQFNSFIQNPSQATARDPLEQLSSTLTSLHGLVQQIKALTG